MQIDDKAWLVKTIRTWYSGFKSTARTTLCTKCIEDNDTYEVVKILRELKMGSICEGCGKKTLCEDEYNETK